ncbi:hypothetical protein CR513_01499, partial [Mucuna pruriens]
MKLKGIDGTRTSEGACERGVFRNANTSGAWLSSTCVIRCWVKSRNEYNPLWNLEQTVSDKSEKIEDDVKSSCSLCPRWHTCYNGRDKGSQSREGELTSKTCPHLELEAIID